MGHKAQRLESNIRFYANDISHNYKPTFVNLAYSAAFPHHISAWRNLQKRFDEPSSDQPYSPTYAYESALQLCT